MHSRCLSDLPSVLTLVASPVQQKTSVESALSTLITDNDSITNNIEASLGNHLMFLAVTEPLIKKYVEDNY